MERILSRRRSSFSNRRTGFSFGQIVSLLILVVFAGGIVWVMFQAGSQPADPNAALPTPTGGIVQIPATSGSSTTSANSSTPLATNQPITAEVKTPPTVPVSGTRTTGNNPAPTGNAASPSATNRPATASVSPTNTFECTFERNTLPNYLKPAHLSALQPQFRSPDKIPAAPTLYEMALLVNPTAFSYSGEITITFWNRARQSMPEVMLRAYPDFFRGLGGELNFISAKVNGRFASLQDRSQTYVAVQPGTSIPACSQATVNVKFSGKIVRQLNENAYAVGTFYAGQNYFALGTFYPQLGIWQPNATGAWDWAVGPLRASSDLTAAEVAFYDVEIEAPTAYNLYGAGVSASPTRQPQTGNKMWRLVGGPFREFAVVGSDSFEPEIVTANAQNNIEVRIVTAKTADSAVKARQDDFAKKARDVSVAALEEYSTLIAPYPYTQYTLVQSPLVGFNGIEWPMFSQYSFELFRKTYQGEEQEYLGLAYSKPGTWVVVHEILHQWFYNLVGNDQQTAPFIDEGLTEYTTYLLPELLAKKLGTPLDSAKRFADSWLDKLKTRLEKEDLAVFGDQPVSSAATQVTLQQAGMLYYRKAPLFYRAYREKFGDEVFFNFLKNYYRKFEYKVVRYNDLVEMLVAAVPGRTEEARAFVLSWLNERNLQKDLKP